MQKRLFSHDSDSQDHHFSGFYEGGGSLSRLQLHFARGTCRDNRCDLLSANRNLYFRHQAANANGIDSSNELIPTTDAANYLLAFRLRFALGSEEEPVQFALRDAMMSSGRSDAANLLPVDPLFDRGKADSQLQSCVPELQQFPVLWS